MRKISILSIISCEKAAQDTAEVVQEELHWERWEDAHLQCFFLRLSPNKTPVTMRNPVAELITVVQVSVLTGDLLVSDTPAEDKHLLSHH